MRKRGNRRRKNNREAQKPKQDKVYKNKGVNTQKASTAPTKPTVSKGKWDKWSDDDYGIYSHYGIHCNHNMKALDVQGVDVHGTSSYGIASRRTKVDECPDFGLYLDDVWKPWWRNEMVQWADYGLPRHLGIAMDQISDAYDRAINGEKVEVSCIGGHGRTGTALAIMCVLGGMHYDDAILHVREAYCKKAIETEDQEWYVQWCWAKHNGETPQPLPERKTYIKQSTRTYPSNGPYNPQKCAKTNHWDYWIAGSNECPIKGNMCSFWTSDVASFTKPNGWTPHSIPPTQTTPSWAGVSRGHVRGYVVPMDVRLKHSDTTAKGCKCDLCRYLDSGHGAFAQPSDNAKAAEFFIGIKELEYKLLRRRKESAGSVDEPADSSGNARFVLFADNNGEIGTIRVAENFKPVPPEDKAGTPNEVRGEYIFRAGRGWVWDPMFKIRPRIHKDL